MKKSTLMTKLENIRLEAEAREIDPEMPLKLLDLLLDYVNDKDVRDAVDEVPM